MDALLNDSEKNGVVGKFDVDGVNECGEWMWMVTECEWWVNENSDWTIIDPSLWLGSKIEIQYAEHT